MAVYVFSVDLLHKRKIKYNRRLSGGSVYDFLIRLPEHSHWAPLKLTDSLAGLSTHQWIRIEYDEGDY